MGSTTFGPSSTLASIFSTGLDSSALVSTGLASTDLRRLPLTSFSRAGTSATFSSYPAISSKSSTMTFLTSAS
jgi:hypothetical protein